MWAELIFTRDDLASLLERALPLSIRLGSAEDERAFSLHDLAEVTLVADVGLRVVCKAHARWPVLGVDLPVTVSALTLVMSPAIEQRVDGDTLVFRVSIEHADFAALPTMIDERITAAINAKLAAKDAELAWNFTKTLTYLVPISSSFAPLVSLSIRPAWGKIRITNEGIVCAVSFHSSLARRDESPPTEVAPAPRLLPP